MIFVRVLINKATREIEHVMAQDWPFEGWQLIGVEGTVYDVADVGMLEELKPEPLTAGAPRTASQHVWDRVRGLKNADLESTRKFLREHPEMPRLHEVPCTRAGIKALMCEKGREHVSVKVRAWLANILPEHQVAEMGLQRGIPISAMKAVEAIRNRRDPHGGSRMPQLEAKAQQLSNERAAGALRARQKKEV